MTVSAMHEDDKPKTADGAGNDASGQGPVTIKPVSRDGEAAILEQMLEDTGSRRESTNEGERIVNPGLGLGDKPAPWVEEATRNLERYVTDNIVPLSRDKKFDF